MMRAWCHWFRCLGLPAVTGCMLLLGGGAVTWAQVVEDIGDEDGPVVINAPRKSLPIFAMNDVSASLDLLFRKRADTRNFAEGDNSTDTENLFRETFNLSTKAFIIHPNLVDLDLSGSLELSQRDVTSESSTFEQGQVDSIAKYDVRATFLRKADTSLTVFAQQDQWWVDRQFTGSLQSIQTSYGGVLNLRLPDWPQQFGITYRDRQLVDSFSDGDTASTNYIFSWQSQLKLSQNQLVDFEYTYEQKEETGRRPLTYQRHDLDVTHTIRFGHDDRNELRSYLVMANQSGDFPFERIRLDETLRLYHSQTLRTRYDYTLNMETFGTTEQTQQRGNVFFEHRLYDSLVTTGNIGAGLLELSDGASTDDMLANITFDHQKQVPNGNLATNLNFGWSQQNNSARGNETQIFGESQTFGSSGLVVLNRSHIIAGSIVVHNDIPGGLPPIFDPGLHYTVAIFPDRVELRRIDGVGGIGGIGNPNPVRIDYRVGAQPASSTDTNTAGISIRYDIDEGPLRGLGIYARMRMVNQTIGGNDEVLAPNSVNDMTVGADYRIPNAFLKAEYQIHDSEIAPFDLMWLEALVYRRTAADMLSARVIYTATDHRDELGGQSGLLTVTGNVRWRLTDKLSLSGEVLWRQQTDRLGSDSTAFQQDVELNWAYRQTRIYARGKNSVFTSDALENTFQTIELGIRREF